MPTTADLFDFSPTALRARREALGLSREHVAIATRSSVSSIISWERGVRTPSPRVRPLIVAALSPDAADTLEAASAEVVAFVRKTTQNSNVPEKLEDPAAARQAAEILKAGAQ